MKILIAGDFCPWDRVANAIEHQDLSCLDPIKFIIQKADYAIVNLECPIVESGMKPIIKSGPNLYANEKVLDCIKEAGFKAVTLANNHFRDYGNDGCENTMHILNKYGIDYVGGGKDIAEASKILFKKNNDKKIAIISCCENECSIATESQAGSNPINPIQQYYQIQEAKKNADVILVIVHGGVEHYPYPTPRMKELYQFYVDAGADVVINHHQHCYSGYEVYKEKPIFYGLGNLCFDRPDKRNDKYNEGYLVELQIEDHLGFKLYPYIQCNEQPIVQPMSNEEQVTFDHDIADINKIIADDHLLAQKFKNFEDMTSLQYQLYVEPYNSKLTRNLFKRCLLPKLMKRKYTTLANVIRCESHRERLLDAIK